MRLADLQTPCLLVRLDRVRANLARMRELLAAHGGVARWRPHVKTSKIPEVLDLLLAAGVRQFKCATTREAQVLLERPLARQEPLDLLVAMPHRGANLARIAQLAARFPHHALSVLTEDAAHAAEVGRLPARVLQFVDLDPGQHRTGVPLADAARIGATVAAAGDSLAGVHFYDGHVRDATAAARQARCAPLYSELLATLRKLPVDAAGLEIVTSGTPSFLQALAFPGFQGRNHRVSPGTVVYWDTTSAGFGIEGFQPAVHVLARVISASTSDCVTLDAGSKAIDAAAGDPCADAVGWPGLVAQTPSEEHLPLLVRHGEPPKPGMLLQLVPRHVCPTVNLADEAVLLEGDSILRIVPVAARGHETAPTGWR